MKKTAVLLTFSVAILISTLSIIQVKAEQWSSPTPIATPWLARQVALSMSADGSKIVYSAWTGDGDCDIFIINSDGTSGKQLTDSSRLEGYASISADGTKIAFLSFKWWDTGAGEPLQVDYQLFVMNSDGTGLSRLTDMETGIPSISGDGSKVAFCSQGLLYVVNSDGTGLKQLTNTSTALDPAISSDGSKIAFIYKVYDSDPNQETNDPYSDDYELVVINSDGTGLRQLTFNHYIYYFDTYPSVSADGNRITFSDGPLFVVNSDGTGLKQLTSNGTTSILYPSINGDGTRIAYSSSQYLYGDSAVTFFLTSTDGSELTNLGSWGFGEVAGGPCISGDGSTIALPFYREGIYVSYNIDIHKDLNPPNSAAAYDGQWHASDFTINLTASDDLLVAATYYKINNGETKNVAEDGQPLIITEGANNTLEYWSRDISGKIEQHRLLTDIKLDKSDPAGSITINDGANSTYSTSVTLSINSSDVSGIAEMRFSHNGTDWTTWEKYTESKSWTLLAGEGSKTAYAQFKDNSGRVSQIYFDSIELVAFKPTTTPQPENSTASLIAASVGIAAALTGTCLLVYLKKFCRNKDP
jgi:Tol biopolymer transport system component